MWTFCRVRVHLPRPPQESNEQIQSVQCSCSFERELPSNPNCGGQLKTAVVSARLRQNASAAASPSPVNMAVEGRCQIIQYHFEMHLVLNILLLHPGLHDRLCSTTTTTATDNRNKHMYLIIFRLIPYFRRKISIFQKQIANCFLLNLSLVLEQVDN